MCNFVNKFNSLDEMDKFLERHMLPKMSPKEIDKKQM